MARHEKHETTNDQTKLGRTEGNPNHQGKHRVVEQRTGEQKDFRPGDPGRAERLAGNTEGWYER